MLARIVREVERIASGAYGEADPVAARVGETFAGWTVVDVGLVSDSVCRSTVFAACACGESWLVRWAAVRDGRSRECRNCRLRRRGADGRFVPRVADLSG